MHNITKFGVGAVAVVLLGACGSDSKAATPTTKAPTPTTVAAAKSTTTVASAAGPTTTAKSSATPTTTVKSPATPTTVKSSTAPSTTVKASTASAAAVDLGTTTVGKVLVDSEGRTLYLFTKDAQNKPSTCEAACATTWPPETTSGTLTAGTGLEASKLTVVKRTDGTEQLAYNGWPLYRYAKDTKAGDDTGQAVGGTWYVVDATGNAVK